MRTTLTALCQLLFLLLFANPANAAIEQAREFYAAGLYEEAAREGEALGDAAGLSLAAKALLADTLFRETPASDAALERVAGNAEQALTLNPKSVEARLSLACVLGVKGRRASLGE